jgi:hypothetical protein
VGISVKLEVGVLDIDNVNKGLRLAAFDSVTLAAALVLVGTTPGAAGVALTIAVWLFVRVPVAMGVPVATFVVASKSVHQQVSSFGERKHICV